MKKVAWISAAAVAVFMAGMGEAGQGPAPRVEPERRGAGGAMDGEGRILRLLDSAKFAKEAGVSQAQIAEIKAKLEVLRKDQSDLRAELEQAGLEQAKLISDRSVNEELLLAAVDKTSSVHAKIARNRIKQLLVVRKILKPEQAEKLYGMIEQRMGKIKDDAEGGPERATRESGKGDAGAPPLTPAPTGSVTAVAEPSDPAPKP